MTIPRRSVLLMRVGDRWFNFHHDRSTPCATCAPTELDKVRLKRLQAACDKWIGTHPLSNGLGGPLGHGLWWNGGSIETIWQREN